MSFYQQLISIALNLQETAFWNIAIYRGFSDHYELQKFKKAGFKTKLHIKLSRAGVFIKKVEMPCTVYTHF